MRASRQIVFKFLEEVTEIASHINRIIVDYFKHEATEILEQENDLYDIFINTQPKTDDIFYVEHCRKQFKKILEEIINGENKYFEHSAFSLSLPKKKSYSKLTAYECLKYFVMVGILADECIPTEFSTFTSKYEYYLPNYTAQIRAFLKSILLFADTHVAITCSQEQFDFLFRLIQHFRDIPGKLSFYPSFRAPTKLVSNFFCDSILSEYLGSKEPLSYRSLRGSFHDRELPNLDCFIFEDVVYIDRNNISAITELKEELPKQMAEWNAYQKEQPATKRGLLTRLLLNTILPSVILDIIVDYQLPFIDDLLKILRGDYKLHPKGPACFLPYEIAERYEKLLTIKKNQVPLYVERNSQCTVYQSTVVANPTKVLSQLVKGCLPNTKPLLDYFLSIRDTLSMFNAAHYKVIIELIEGLLLHAETHVCIDLNDAFYARISKLTQKALAKLDKKSYLKQQDQFQNQLNTLFSSSEKISPISLVVVQNEETRLYVEADAIEVISYLESCTQSQDIFSSSSCSSSFMFNKPQLPAPDKTGSPSEQRTLSLP